jgi:hypothetical protein
MSRRILQGLKEIASHLGLQSHTLDARRVLLSWIDREALPARRLAGRWYADAAEIDTWWDSRRSEQPRSNGSAAKSSAEDASD